MSNSSVLERGNKLTNAVVVVMLVLIGVVMILPLLFMLSTSLKSNVEIYVFPASMIPKDIRWDNFINVFSEITLLSFIKNSLTVALLTTIGTVFSSAFVAYGFARYKARFKNVLFIIIISTLLLPIPAIIIPQFLVFRQFGWVDTFKPLIVPAFFGSAYNIFLLRQFFSSLPNDLFEAARVDGCSEIKTWWRIGLPLCKSALATVAVFQFIWSWNDLFSPAIFLNSPEKFTLPIGMSSLFSPYNKVPWNTIMVGNFYALFPLVILFIYAQKYFVEGIAISGLK